MGNEVKNEELNVETPVVSEEVIPVEVAPVIDETPVAPVEAAPAVEAPVAPVQPVAPAMPVQQPVQPMMNNMVQPTNNGKKSNKTLFIILGIIAVIVIVGVVFVMLNKKDNKESKDTNTNTEVNTNSNSETNTNSNTSGSVDPNTNTSATADGAFLMPIEDVFTITGRGTVVTGRIERGTVKINDEIQIIGLDKEIKTAKVTGIEMFRKNLDSATVGDNAGIVLSGVTREDVQRGQVIAKPNSISAEKKFEAEIYLLTKDEGGRTTPIYNNYRPQFYFRTTDVTGVVAFPTGTDSVEPGTTITANCELVNGMAMEVGTEFTIREGGRTVGKGKVTKIIK